MFNRRSLKAIGVSAAALLGVAGALVSSQSKAVADIPGVTVVGSCGAPASANNFMDITNNRPTSVTITVGGVDTDTGLVNFIDSRTYAPGEHATINIDKKYDNATAQDDNMTSDNTHPSTTTTTSPSSIPGVTVTGSCAAANEPNNFMQLTNNRAQSVDINISGDDFESHVHEFIAFKTLPPNGQPVTVNIPTRFELARADEVNQPANTTTINYEQLCGNTHPTTTTTTTTTTGLVTAHVQLTPSTVAAGGTVTVAGGGFAANQQLQITLFSNPVSLGTTTSDGSGNFSAMVIIPSGTADGQHDIGVSGPGPGGGLLQGVDTLTVLSVNLAPARSLTEAPAPAAPATAVSASPNFTG